MTHPLLCFLLQLIELGESLHAIFVVDNTTGFAAAVHSEDGIALAAKTIDSGAAVRTLEAMVQATNA